MAENINIAYYVDGVNFKTYGVYVSASSGIVNRPKLKTPASLSWDNYHGESVDLQHKYFEPREITLSCFVKAESKADFLTKVSGFQALFDKTGTQRLLIDVNSIPLIYEVYCKDEIEVKKTWSADTMIGTFDLKLTEPEPVKRVLKFSCTSSSMTCTITMTTDKYVNVFWGDGEVDYDVSGSVSHTYDSTGSYYPVIAGCIDEITGFSSNATTIWDKI